MKSLLYAGTPIVINATTVKSLSAVAVLLKVPDTTDLIADSPVASPNSSTTSVFSQLPILSSSKPAVSASAQAFPTFNVKTDEKATVPISIVEKSDLNIFVHFFIIHPPVIIYSFFHCIHFFFKHYLALNY